MIFRERNRVCIFLVIEKGVHVSVSFLRFGGRKSGEGARSVVDNRRSLAYGLLEMKERRQRLVGVTGRDFIRGFGVGEASSEVCGGDVDWSHRPICRSIPPVEVEEASFEEFDRQ
ncbi:hypothetical protein L2E82_43231 [Cichorium intybus]|uniref:Uncharacterized protein n=1 Tax=Cichorium intybus TaxID=13427 RepID=A0ACB8ZN86_CICIN|nr:hypothetical protein L2E82_43231 [Cichorium intybus]